MSDALTLDVLLERNRNWAEGIKQEDPEFFSRLSAQQAPQYMWIGCADSRVPANEILGLAPGEIFVHRNVANVVVHSDLNCLSVIQFAIDVLKVRNIIVCGHYGCGGVLAALRDDKLGLIDNWLRHVQDVRNRHRGDLQSLADERARMHRLCELNVLSQAINVAETTLLQDAWARGQQVEVHGLIYNVGDGILRKLGPPIGNPDDLAEQKQKLGI